LLSFAQNTARGVEPQPERILIIRPSALGDVCRTVPVLVSLKRAWPAAQIDWLVRDAFAEAVAHHPDLDRVVLFRRSEISGDAKRGRLAPMMRLLRELRRERYDLVLDCQGLARSGLFALTTGARRRVGYADAREMGWLGLNRRVRVGHIAHTVDRMLALANDAGADPVTDMTLYPAPGEIRAIDADPEIGSSRYALLAPTSLWPGKRWPPDRFAQLARALLERGFERVVVTGTSGERGQIGPLLDLARDDPRVVDRVGRTSVGAMLALVAKSSLVVANDSAALHMGVGLGRHLVALFGPTLADRVGPYRREADVIQHLGPGERPGHKNTNAGQSLMRRISVDEVLARVDQMESGRG
jgi:heptosyltransferase-1